MKTPIMSIAGGLEGLMDLISEYEQSIQTPQVTKEDHLEIAHDMREWIDKIKLHNSYMSDIITAVKGQAVNMNMEQTTTFTIDELLKGVNILMKHETKNANIKLNMNLDISPDTVLKGDINSLIQVLNNMITNAIHSYEGTPGKINVNVSENTESILVAVEDKGCGMDNKVKDKLFKEMITTKGKNGTGLGLYMSYSTIKGKFNGSITFDSEVGKGSTFYIILPK